jgi:hypothetical protein
MDFQEIDEAVAVNCSSVIGAYRGIRYLVTARSTIARVSLPPDPTSRNHFSGVDRQSPFKYSRKNKRLLACIIHESTTDEEFL